MSRTFTLDDELAEKVEAAAARVNRPVDEVLKAAVRRGLATSADAPLYELKGRLLDSVPGTNFNFDKVEALLDEVEGPFRK
jgi:predicted transcriptional regulator